MSITRIFRCFYCLDPLNVGWSKYYHNSSYIPHDTLHGYTRGEKYYARQCHFKNKPMFDFGLGDFAYPAVSNLETAVFHKLIAKNEALQKLISSLREIRAAAILATGKDPYA